MLKRNSIITEYGLFSSILLNIVAMEDNINFNNNEIIQTKNNINSINKEEKIQQNYEKINQKKLNNENSDLFNCVTDLKNFYLQGYDMYNQLHFLDKLRQNPYNINIITKKTDETGKILSDICEIFEFRRLLPLKDYNEICLSVKENKLDKLKENEVKYLNSDIFGGKFFYNFSDNIFDETEIATTFKIFGNIFRKFNSIKNIFTDVFKKDLYFLLCDRTSNDKSLLKLINRKLQKYNKSIESFKSFDTDFVNYDIDISSEESTFTYGFNNLLVICLYDYSRDKNIQKKKFLKEHLEMLLPDCVNKFNERVFSICELFSYSLLDSNALKIYNQCWKFSHEFFHSLDKCTTSLLNNTKFSFIENGKIVSNISTFEYICGSIIKDGIESKTVKIFREILENDTKLATDFIEYLTNITFLKKFDTGYDKKKNYHTLYMFDDFDKLEDIFLKYSAYINSINDTKNNIFHLFFFEKYSDYSQFNDVSLKNRLDVLRKEINKIGDELPTIESGNHRGDIVIKLENNLREYYINFYNSKDFNCSKEVSILYNDVFSKKNLDLFDELNKESDPKSKFGFQIHLLYLLDCKRKCEDNILALRPKLNLSEFLAEAFVLSHLPDVFHDGPAAFTSCYFKYLNFVHNSYLEFSSKNNIQDKCLLDYLLEILK